MSHRAGSISGIDHIVLACSDLGCAALAAEWMGFTVTDENHHEKFKTANRLIVLSEGYIELLAMHGAHPEEDWVHERLSSALGRGGGLVMVALATDDASKAHSELGGRGVATVAPTTWTREAKSEIGIGLARFTTMPLSSPPQLGISFFVCQQHTPEMVWRNAWLKHANSAVRLTGIQQRVDNPGEWTTELERLFGQCSQNRGGSVEIDLGGSRLAFSSGDASVGPPWANGSASDRTMLTIAVESVEAARRKYANRRLVDMPHRLVVSVDAIPGVLFQFIPADPT